MIRYQLAAIGLELSIDVEQADQLGKLAAKSAYGDTDEESFITDLVGRSAGAYGHSIDVESMRPIDLANALASERFALYEPELKQGSRMLANYRLGIPDGAIT